MFYTRLLLGLLVAAALCRTEELRVTLLATTDLHANIFPYDYYTGRPAERGLAKLATLIAEARRDAPEALLIDVGDTIQGAPIATVYQQYVRTGRLPLGLGLPDAPFRGDPMMLVMNHLRFDAMVLGNHEFNFGLKVLAMARADARFPWLSANTVAEPAAKVKPFDPYIVKTVRGVRVAVIGITTPGIPNWEKPENYRGYRFLRGRDVAAAMAAEVRARRGADIVIAAVHGGMPRRQGDEENEVASIAEAPGIDAIVYGHSHQEQAGRRAGDVLLMQPRNWGISLGRMDFVVERLSGRAKIVSKTSRLIPVRREVAADPQVLALARPYHEVTERYLDTAVATSPAAISAADGRFRDNALVDAIHKVQLHYAQADVSLTSLFNTRAAVPAGPVTVRQIASLYLYDNELYAVEATGKMLREALENAARYFRQCPTEACEQGPLINDKVAGFNYDMAQGVEYQVDLRRPEGQRIVNLRFRGKPLEDGQKLRLALNNYRAAGSGGYSMFRDAKIVWRSAVEIRDLIIAFYGERKTLAAEADGNWRIVPDAARDTLLRETLPAQEH